MKWVWILYLKTKVRIPVLVLISYVTWLRFLVFLSLSLFTYAKSARLLCSWDSLAKILEWVAIPSSRGSFWPRDGTRVSCIAGGFFTTSTTWEAPLSSVQFSRSVVSDSLRPHESQHAKPPCPSPTPRVHSNSYPSSQWCHPAISSSVTPSPPAPNPSQHQSLFQWVNSSHEVAKVLEFQL